MLVKSDESNFASGSYSNINYNQWIANEVGVEKNDANIYSVPQGTYLVIARFSASNHVAGKSFNLRAYVDEKEYYTVYGRSVGGWQTEEIVFSFTGSKFSIALYQDTGTGVMNIKEMHTSLEVIRLH